jgi:hypothetical protein
MYGRYLFYAFLCLILIFGSCTSEKADLETTDTGEIASEKAEEASSVLRAF